MVRFKLCLNKPLIHDFQLHWVPLTTNSVKKILEKWKNTGKVREFCQSGKVGPMVWEILDPSLNCPALLFQFTEKGGFSAKGKVPWIEYNGETVADSQFIIKYLNKKFGKGRFTLRESERDFYCPQTKLRKAGGCLPKGGVCQGGVCLGGVVCRGV